MTTINHPQRIKVRPAHAHAHHRSITPAQLVRPAPRTTWDPLGVDAEGSIPHDYDEFLTRPETTSSPKDIGHFSSILTKAVAEVLLGSRSPSQVQNWLCEDVWHIVRRRAALGARSGYQNPHAQVQVMRVHPCQISERIYEVSVVLHDGVRVRAAALRLVLHRKKWRAAALRIG